MLDWDYEGLSGTIPAEIGAHSVIRHLFSDHNELSGSIPPTIGALTNLKSLDLNRSHLSGVVPSTLSNLTNLEYMDLMGKDSPTLQPPTSTASRWSKTTSSHSGAL